MTDQIGNTNVPQLIDNKPIEIVKQKVEKMIELRKKRIEEKNFRWEQVTFLSSLSPYIFKLFDLDKNKFEYDSDISQRFTFLGYTVCLPKDFLSLSNEEIITLVEHLLESGREKKRGLWSLSELGGIFEEYEVLQKKGMDVKILILDSVNEARKKAGIVVDLEEKGIYKGETA